MAIKTKYSAPVRDKFLRTYHLIENREYSTKAAFIKALRANGFRVNPAKVKPSHIFDYIINNTNAAPQDWKFICTDADVELHQKDSSEFFDIKFAEQAKRRNKGRI